MHIFGAHRIYYISESNAFFLWRNGKAFCSPRAVAFSQRVFLCYKYFIHKINHRMKKALSTECSLVREFARLTRSPRETAGNVTNPAASLPGRCADRVVKIIKTPTSWYLTCMYGNLPALQGLRGRRRAMLRTQQLRCRVDVRTKSSK